jgi:hypothetical protein
MPDYNVIMSVMGPEKKDADKIMGDIIKKIKIQTREAPEFLSKDFDKIAELFDALFKEPVYH